MYRDVFIRVYDVEAITKVDLLREKGINITELLVKAIIEYEIKPELELVS